MTQAAEAVVIVGGPGIGKTETKRTLRRLGFPVLNEAGSVVIRHGIYHPAKDRHAFQMVTLKRQIHVESRRLKPGINWLDRGRLDGGPYYIMDGLPVPEEFYQTDVSHYKAALLLEPLPFFENDGIRYEGLEFTHNIMPVFEEFYSINGVPVIRVPYFPAETIDMAVRLRLAYAFDRLRPFISYPELLNVPLLT